MRPLASAHHIFDNDAVEIMRQIPHRALRGHVRSFGQRRATLTNHITITSLPARPDQFIEFYLAERYAIGRDHGPDQLAPETAVVGPQTRPGVQLRMSGVIDVFTIRFHPTGFHRLFGLPMVDIADQGIAIGDLVGRSAPELVDAVQAAATFSDRIVAAEHWLFKRLEYSRAPTAFDHAVRLLAASRGRTPLGPVAARSGLGSRQFQRRFLHAVGVTPKLYARTLRLEAALDARRRHPNRSWTDIAYGAGYTDQAHFIRDCSALAGASPTRFFATETTVTEIYN